jgi:DNA-binding response OmpR family regulator
MPGMDGLATTQAVVDMLNRRGVPQELRPKIIMLTSVDERDTKIDAIYGCGADWYLVKPLDEADLIMAMEGLGLSLPGEMV